MLLVVVHLLVLLAHVLPLPLSVSISLSSFILLFFLFDILCLFFLVLVLALVAIFCLCSCLFLVFVFFLFLFFMILFLFPTFSSIAFFLFFFFYSSCSWPLVPALVLFFSCSSLFLFFLFFFHFLLPLRATRSSSERSRSARFVSRSRATPSADMWSVSAAKDLRATASAASQRRPTTTVAAGVDWAGWSSEWKRRDEGDSWAKEKSHVSWLWLHDATQWHVDCGHKSIKHTALTSQCTVRVRVSVSQ